MDLFTIFPNSFQGIVYLVLDVVIIFLALMAADKHIAHRFEPKHVLIMSILAYFLGPITLSFLSGYVSIPYAFVLFPLVLWIVLGEIFLDDFDFKTKLKVAVIGFLIYEIITILNVTEYLVGSLV